MKLIGYLLFGLIVGVLGLVAVALLITLLVGVVFALVPGPNPEVSRCAQILPAPLILLPFCPAIALGIWVGLGGKPTLWRLVGVVVAITACVCLARITSCEPGVDGLLLILMAQTVGGSLPLLVARAVGLELKDYSRIGSTELLRRMMETEGSGKDADRGDGRPWLQFSLSSMFSWGIALAVLLSCMSTFRAISGEVFDGVLRSDFLNVLFWIGSYAVMLPLALWAALGNRWLAARIVALGLIPPAVAITIFIGSGPRHVSLLIELIVFMLIVSVWLAGSFCALRAGGYGLVWRRSVEL